MKGSSARRATGMALTAIAILALATSSVFAGRSDTKDNGNKYGNENKKVTWNCPDDYWGTYGVSNPADLNQNGFYCYKWTGDSYTYIDDISGQPSVN
jgi:hypothetical protein